MHRHAGGFTLIELMIAMTLALLVIIGVSDILLGQLRYSLYHRNTETLLQETARINTFIYTELRRAGYMRTIPANPAAAPQQTVFLSPGTSAANCVRFAYDSNRGSERFFGFRLQDGVLQWYAGANARPCNSINTGWLPLTSLQHIRVTAFGVKQSDNGLSYTLTTRAPQGKDDEQLTETHYVMPRNFIDNPHARMVSEP